MLALLAGIAGLLGQGSAYVLEYGYNPTGWVQIGKTDPAKSVNLLFAVKQQNIDELERTLYDVSIPSSDNYGNFLTLQEINEMVKPLDSDIVAIKTWLMSHGIDESQIVAETSNSDFISVATTYEKAEQILSCEYYDYYNEKKKDLIVSRVKMGTNYEVDYSVRLALDYVVPTVRFPPVSSLTVHARDPMATDNTPAVLKEMYNVSSNAVGKSSKNLQGIASFVEQYYGTKDLETFWKTYDITPCNVTKIPSDTPDGTGDEADLDTQYISSLGEQISMQVWYTSGRFQEAMSDWVVNLQKATVRPLLFSVSYGLPEPEWAGAIPRLNTEFMKAGALGISIFFASGDSGAGGGCHDGVFQPEFPGSSAYVTSVGGLTPGSDDESERVWSPGGGGFSNYAGIQTWQETAVQDYFTTANDKLPKQSEWNRTGRGYPDVSAEAVNFVIYIDERKVVVDGTSCASPTAAGIFSLLNDLRLQNSMQQFGFLNPFIYETAAKDSKAFNDVTSGSNSGCSGVAAGFPAVKGWDASSGWGSPNYGVLTSYALESGKKTMKFFK